MGGDDMNSDEEEIWGMLEGCADEEEEETVKTAPSAVPAGEAAAPAAAAIAAAAATVQNCAATPSAETAVAPQSTCCGGGAANGSTCGNSASAPSREQRRRFAGARGHRIPADILEDPELNAAIEAVLPKSHNFEIHRTVWRLRRSGARHVGLQMPEGLHQWALGLADIITTFAPNVETTTIMGDVTFGACCIDDLGARAVGVDFIVHYGHSCIVPTDQTVVSTLYIHVEVEIDVEHLVETVRLNFTADKVLAFMGTVQFTPGMVEAVKELRSEFFDDKSSAKVPQVKPLSTGETLGCTSPLVDPDVDAVVFVCDGRFHLESAMIQNPNVKGGFFRYDPFYKTLHRESFAHGEMHTQRKAAIASARGAKMVGLILSTLGRQGSSGVMEGVERLLTDRGIPHVTVLLSDVSPDRLARFNGVDCWVQVACPRLSVDWGDAFSVPLLTPYEAHIAFGEAVYQDIYPMDYYSNRGGPWSNYGAHNGYGGSLDSKFRHLGRKRVEYEEDALIVN